MDSTVHGILQSRILAWVAIPFSKGILPNRDQTQVSGIAGGFFTSWATREVVKNPPADSGDGGSIPGWDGLATHSSVPAQRILWTEEPAGPQSMGSKESDLTEVT